MISPAGDPNFMGDCKFAERPRPCTMGCSSSHISNFQVTLKALALNSIWLRRIRSYSRCCSWLASSVALESRRPTPSPHTIALLISKKRRLTFLPKTACCASSPPPPAEPSPAKLAAACHRATGLQAAAGSEAPPLPSRRRRRAAACRRAAARRRAAGCSAGMRPPDKPHDKLASDKLR